MKYVLKLEEAAMLALSIYLFTYLDISWWWFLIFFLSPDIGLLGYLINNKVGAIVYNLFHSKTIAIMIYLSGLISGNEILQFAGLIIFAHSSFDRMLGYGLKHFDSFHSTHLGFLKNIPGRFNSN